MREAVETGVSIRVADLGKIPSGAKRLAEAIKKILGVEPKYTAARGIGADDFTLFAGTNPSEKLTRMAISTAQV
jgi:hypothetical protein